MDGLTIESIAGRDNSAAFPRHGLCQMNIGRAVGAKFASAFGRYERAVSDYRDIVEQYKQRYDIRVRRWRRNMSGCAWRVYHHDGRVCNWIESPIPKTPISLAIFLHEVGHHVIGFHRYRKRCEEEYHAWEWAIREMRKLGIQPDEKVKRRFNLSMQYAVGKAMRRGMKQLPMTLAPFMPQAA